MFNYNSASIVVLLVAVGLTIVSVANFANLRYPQCRFEESQKTLQPPQLLPERFRPIQSLWFEILEVQLL